ncbi:hypothetical protein N7468_004784 [Penicillium chermesinum]|uniref:RRM domain-containing protein n=1 Tax=Penicillium chermesinum TaxID=63820 RepID=A0A9W9P9E9_9EURO|nr:uncharacterized protein N7468_004784 [Penicillium chermesinum]KAJ5240165.1 hypothetical protein N7468_004784 [Penicillium chermesinum]
MSLKPFQIRDLHEGISGGAEGKLVGFSSAPGIVQISASEYDNLADSHPRARLTYLDEDDGDQITVGYTCLIFTCGKMSDFGFFNRLDLHSSSPSALMKPWGPNPPLVPTESSEDSPSPMHIFDIRRSNSVTELWKKYEIKGSRPQASESVDTSSNIEPIPHVTATSTPGDESQPLLAAFEAELANILNAAEDSSEIRTQRSDPEPAPEQSTTGEQRTPHPAELLAAQILHHLVHGANIVQSELRSRWPDLQRQLHEAQRNIPENVIPSLQSMLATIETHMRTAYNNIPNSSRQWAENTYNAGRPVAENAAENLRTMASDFNQIGRTLFAAFESELSRFSLQEMNAATEGAAPTAPVSSTSTGPASEPASSHSGQPSEHQASNTTGQDMKSEFPGPGQPTACDRVNHDSASNAAPDHRDLPNQNDSPYSLRTDPSHHFNNRFSRPYPPPPPPPPVGPAGFFTSHPPAPHYQPPWSFTPRPYGDPRHYGTGHFGHGPPHPGPAHAAAQPPAFYPFSSGAWPPRAPWYSPPEWNWQHKPGAKTGSEASLVSEADARNKTLFIGNVGFRVTEKTIRDVFAAKGFIVDVDLPMDSVSGKHAGFGYLKFPSFDAAIAGMQSLQGAHIDGHAINLEFSHSVPSQGIGHPQPRDTANQSPNETQDANDISSAKAPTSSDAELKKTPSIRRRKSVSFREPAKSEGNAIPHPLESLKTESESAGFTPAFDASIENRSTHSTFVYSPYTRRPCQPQSRRTDEPVPTRLSIRSTSPGRSTSAPSIWLW